MPFLSRYTFSHACPTLDLLDTVFEQCMHESKKHGKNILPWALPFLTYDVGDVRIQRASSHTAVLKSPAYKNQHLTLK